LEGRFANAASALRLRHGGTVVVLGEGVDRAAAARSVVERIGPPVVDLTGRTDLGVLGAVISRLSLLLTNDSGPAHIAYALGTPTVTIFGETDPEQWGPPPGGPFRVARRVLPCWPCPEERCMIDYACLRSVPVDRVIGAATELMGKI